MLFNSLKYLLFLTVVVVLYYVLPRKVRSSFLILVSFFFYMCWAPIFGPLLAYMILLSWGGAKWLTKSTDAKSRKRKVTLLVVLLLAPLCLFKYTGFIAANLNALFAFLKPFNAMHINWPELAQPIGVSFFTFMAIGYVVDVYRNDTRLLSLHRTAAFISFFPHLSAGPIGRAGAMAPQFDQYHKLTSEQFKQGVSLLLLGWFKKAVVADRLFVYISNVYDNVPHHSGISLLLASVFFAVQLYCDFAAYSDMACGSARLLGFKLTTNFQRPYLATSVRFFWSRWHISLTSWFRDYLFAPIYKSWLKERKKLHALPTAVITIIVFAVSGLWHGAGWTFLIWGVLNGLYLSLEPPLLKRLYKLEKRLPQTALVNWTSVWIKRGVTFVLMAFSFVFFRARSLGDAGLILQRIATWAPGGLYKPSTVMLSMLACGMMLLIDLHEEKTKQIGGFLLSRSLVLTSIKITVFVVVIMLLGVLDNSQFIYFQF